MAKEVIWSFRAQRDRIEILNYWKERNKSKTYSIKLNALFEQTINLISEFPEIGRIVNIRGIRVKTIRDYSIFYFKEENSIEILIIWDNRRDPDVLQKILAG